MGGENIEINYTAVAAAQMLVKDSGYFVFGPTEIFGILIAALWIFYLTIAITDISTKRATLRYVWENGIAHTQQEYKKWFLKWKHNIKD